MNEHPKRKLGCWWFLCIPAVLLLLFIAQMWGPSPKIRVSKETTYLISDLDHDGLPNYTQYTHERMREGVLTEENAAALYWKALWPGELSADPTSQQLVCDALGIKMPKPEEGLVEPYTSAQGELATWFLQEILPPPTDDDASEQNQTPTDAGDVADLNDDDPDFEDATDIPEPSIAAQQRIDLADEIADEVVSQSRYLPWTREQIPALAKWADQNKQPLDWLVEGASRPKYYNPSPNMVDGSDSSMLEMLLPGVQMLRGGARALMSRAMLNLGEGRIDEAWEDTKACHLMGRHAANGGWTLVEQLVGIAIDAMASEATQTILHHGQLTEKQAERIHRDLLDMPHMPNMSLAMSEGERLMFLDITKRLATNQWDLNDFSSLNGGSSDNPAMAFATTTRIDWNRVMERGNKWYDRLTEAAALPRMERGDELNLIEQEIQKLNPQNNRALMAGSLVSSKARSELMSDVMLSLFLPAVTACSSASDRAYNLHELNRLAAALSVHRARNGGYPDKLDELVPSTIDRLPVDGYSGKSFVYLKHEEGYLLYSVFENGVDDQGRDVYGRSLGTKWLKPKDNHDMSNSDLVILVPRQELVFEPEDD